MRSIGFGLERIALVALARPWPAAVIFLALLALLGYGLTRLSFDEDLRNVFAGDSSAFAAYQQATADFVDPENETLVLVEGGSLGQPADFAKLSELQLELQLIEGVDSVYSLFALTEPPDANGDAAPLVADPAAGLTPEVAARIRAHPILGGKLLSADGTAMLFVVTPLEARAPPAVSRRLNAAISDTARSVLGGTDLSVTITGFPAICAGIVDVVRTDQIVLNAAGAAIGLVISLIVFRSFVGALLTAVPAILAGLAVVGGMGLAGVPVTIMSNVVPVLVMVVGYVDGMQLTFMFRLQRERGAAVAVAEATALRQVGGAVVLSAVTITVAFLSLLTTDVTMVRDFGLVGAIGAMGGALIVLVAHALATRLFGRFWRLTTTRRDLLSALAAPSGAVCRWAIANARAIGIASIAVFVLFVVLHYSVPPEQSIREHLPASNPANAALGRIDRAFDGAFPVEIVVPLAGQAATSPEALQKIAAVQQAVAAVEGAGAPLSLWNLVEWLGGTADPATIERLNTLLEQVNPSTRSRFIGRSGQALVTVSIREAPSYATAALIDRIEAAARSAGGPDITVTGVTVVTTRAAVATIEKLDISLVLDVLVNIAIIMVAFGSITIGAVSFLPNIIPIVGIGALLFVAGRGMQMTSVVALTVAFGVAVDNTIHYVNRFRVLANGQPLDALLVETSRQIGPVMLGTTLVIIAGLTTTLTSGLPTIVLFGMITAATLAGALVSDLVILPALMAGMARRWFEPKRKMETVGGSEAQASR